MPRISRNRLSTSQRFNALKRAWANYGCGRSISDPIFMNENVAEDEDLFDIMIGSNNEYPATPMHAPNQLCTIQSRDDDGGSGSNFDGKVVFEKHLQPQANTYVQTNLNSQAPNVRLDNDVPVIIVDTNQITQVVLSNNQTLNSELLQLVRCVKLYISVTPNTQTVQMDNLRYNLTSVPLDCKVTTYSLGEDTPLSGVSIKPGQEIVIVLAPKVNLVGAYYLQNEVAGDVATIFDKNHYGRRIIVLTQQNGAANNQCTINCRLRLEIAQMYSMGGLYLNATTNCAPVCARNIAGRGTYLQTGGR